MEGWRAGWRAAPLTTTSRWASRLRLRAFNPCQRRPAAAAAGRSIVWPAASVRLTSLACRPLLLLLSPTHPATLVFVQITGAGDPTGRGIGYSLIRDVRHKVGVRAGGWVGSSPPPAQIPDTACGVCWW